VVEAGDWQPEEKAVMEELLGDYHVGVKIVMGELLEIGRAHV
jgi:hypothetical protein